MPTDLAFDATIFAGTLAIYFAGCLAMLRLMRVVQPGLRSAGAVMVRGVGTTLARLRSALTLLAPLVVMSATVAGAILVALAILTVLINR